MADTSQKCNQLNIKVLLLFVFAVSLLLFWTLYSNIQLQINYVDTSECFTITHTRFLNKYKNIQCVYVRVRSCTYPSAIIIPAPVVKCNWLEYCLQRVSFTVWSICARIEKILEDLKWWWWFLSFSENEIIRLKVKVIVSKIKNGNALDWRWSHWTV